jgi:hypothetical protein
MDLIGAVGDLFQDLAERRQGSTKLEMRRQRGFRNEDWLTIALRPTRPGAAAIHVDVVADEIVFGVSEYGCRIDLEIGAQLSPEKALDELQRLLSAVLGGGYSEVVKRIPLLGRHVEGVLTLEHKTIHLRSGLPFGTLLPGRSDVIHYQAY